LDDRRFIVQRMRSVWGEALVIACAVRPFAAVQHEIDEFPAVAPEA
jgi:hypothetical protein